MAASDHPLGHITAVRGTRCTAAFRFSGDGLTRLAGVGVGDLVKVLIDEAAVYGLISALDAPMAAADGATTGLGHIEFELIGEVVGPSGVGFQRGCSLSPPLGHPVLPVDQQDIKIVYAPPAKATIRVGSIHRRQDVPAHLTTDDLLCKHFAILGTTGSGKSCASALILQAVLDANPCGHVVLLDPHDEYASAFEGRAELVDITNLQLPYWFLNFDELTEVLVSKNEDTRDSETRILRDAVLRAKREHPENADFVGHLTVDTPVPFRLSSLKKLIDDEMGTLNKSENSGHFLRLLARIESLASDKRYSFMFSNYMVRDMMAEVISRLLRLPGDGRPMTIISLSGIPSEVTDVAVSVLCRLTFDFAHWRRKEGSLPILFVCEEAHRYIPEGHQAGFFPTKRALAQIAKEGRKYGVSLGLISQRPSELSTSILSQCGTIIALRMNNERDIAFVRSALPEGSASLIDTLPILRTGEAVIVGEAAPVPARIKLSTLPENARPRSGSVSFSGGWQSESVDPAMIAETVTRWRQQRRKEGPEEEPAPAAKPTPPRKAGPGFFTPTKTR